VHGAGRSSLVVGLESAEPEIGQDETAPPRAANTLPRHPGGTLSRFRGYCEKSPGIMRFPRAKPASSRFPWPSWRWSVGGAWVERGWSGSGRRRRRRGHHPGRK